MSDISVSSIRNLIFTTVPGDDDEFYDPCSAAEKIEFAVKRLVANSFDKGQEVGRLYSVSPFYFARPSINSRHVVRQMSLPWEAVRSRQRLGVLCTPRLYFPSLPTLRQ